MVEPLIPQSHHTSRDWIVDAFNIAKPTVIRSLQMARSTVTVSFDRWLADKELDMLGVVAHYLDSDLELKTALLALKPSFGHDAKNSKTPCSPYSESTRSVIRPGTSLQTMLRTTMPPCAFRPTTSM